MASLGVLDRLTRFREYMAHLDAAADPRHAIARGLFVARPLRKGRSLFEEIAGRLELHPGSTHLVLGGIGSGKTTQLLMAEKRLAENLDCTALYIDVSLHQDISKLRPQTLLALAGLRLEERLDMESRTALKQPLARLHELGRGYGYYEIDYDAYEPSDDEPPERDDEPPERDYEPPTVFRRVAPLITPPTAESVMTPWNETAEILRAIHERLAARTSHVILMLDSMDRIADPTVFERAVADDLAILRKMGIGVVMVGPAALLYGTHRAIARRFDQMHMVTTPDPEDSTEREFLLRVLDARAPAGLLSAEGSVRLVHLSGGVLRDLVGIARNAGEEAYLSGDESITENHADAAGEEFGRTLLLGLDPSELAKLQAVRTQGQFIPTMDKDLALLITGRILEYRSERAIRYAVHPTIKGLLAQLAGET